MISSEQIGFYFLQQPEVANWSLLGDVWQRYAKNIHAWLLPELACRAVGGDVKQAIPMVTAIACCHISIVLVDDILDDDPKGLYQQMGTGVAANLSLAFQAIAYRVVQQAAQDLGLATAVQHKLWAELIQLNLQTAYGQHLDVQKMLNEEHYWHTVEAKSAPYYGASFYVGALVGGADERLANQLRQFGCLIGKLIQVSDDLADVYQIPANPDWQRGTGNLAILYARLAEHPGQERFESLLPHIQESAALEEAQQILLESGAASYCVYHLLQLAREARTVLDECDLARPKLLQGFLAKRIEHLFQLLEATDAPLPQELAQALLV